MERTYEFDQSNIPPTAAPSAEYWEMAWKEGINANFHTQVQLGGQDGAINLPRHTACGAEGCTGRTTALNLWVLSAA